MPVKTFLISVFYLKNRNIAAWRHVLLTMINNYIVLKTEKLTCQRDLDEVRVLNWNPLCVTLGRPLLARAQDDLLISSRYVNPVQVNRQHTRNLLPYCIS